VKAIDSEAIGEPGQRAFRIRVWKDELSASLWLEKQQLQALSLALRQVLARQQSSGAPRSSSLSTSAFPDTPTVDMHIGRLALGRDQASGRLVLWFHEVEREEDAPPDLVCQLDMTQIATFCDTADALCAAGRPLCALCGAPMDVSGHMCVRKNGHSEREVPSVDEEESD
jgi:uncharacterized repeat protein (TIGR03847 family)